MPMIYLCDADALDNNEIRQVMVTDLPPIAVYRVLDEFYATDDTCSHGEASLADGDVDDDFRVYCPWHNGAFDIRSGEPCAFPCVKPIKVYPLTIEGGKVYLAAPAGAA